MRPFHPKKSDTVSITLAATPSAALKITDAPGLIQVRVMNDSTATAFIVFSDNTASASTSVDVPIGSGGTEVFTFDAPAAGLWVSAVVATGTPGKLYITPGVGF